MTSRLAFVAVVVAACVAVPGELAPSREPAQSPDPGGTETSPSPASSMGPRPSPSGVAPSTPVVADPHDAIEAGRGLLEARAANVDMSLRREKGPDDPAETLIVFEGRVEPALRRGHVRLDFSGMVAIPGSTESPNPDSIVEMIWTPDELHARSATKPRDTWASRSRADARAGSGYVGRVPDEVLGLVTLVATSQAEKIVALEDAQIDGNEARRWLVRVSVEAADVEGVPADVPDAAVLREVYGIDAIEVEVWLVDGILRRVRYAISREKALSGGPDRTTVTYDWSSASSAESIVVPPPP